MKFRVALIMPIGFLYAVAALGKTRRLQAVSS